MPYEIRYSPRARNEEIQILEYIIEQFGHQKAKEFFALIEKRLSDIAEMPEMFRSSSKHKSIRKCVLSKQTSIYYRVRGEFIEIISFRTNRKNPEKFKL